MKSKYLTIAIISLLVVYLFGCKAAPSKESSQPVQSKVWPKDFIIALIPERNIFAQKQKYQPICDYLSKNIGYNVKTKVLESYGAMYKEMKEKRVDAGFFGSFNFSMTEAKIGIVPLVRPLWLTGVSTYRGFIFIRKDSGLKLDIKTWKNKRLALVHQQTTAGYFYLIWYLYQQGITDWRSYFSKIMFMGSHDAAIYAVFNKEADIGAAKDTVYNEVMANNPQMAQEMQVLAESHAVPSNGLAVSPDVPVELREKIKNVLLNMDQNPEGTAILTKFQAIKFIENKLSDYQPVLEMIEPLKVDLKTYGYEGEEVK